MSSMHEVSEEGNEQHEQWFAVTLEKLVEHVNELFPAGDRVRAVGHLAARYGLGQVVAVAERDLKELEEALRCDPDGQAAMREAAEFYEGKTFDRTYGTNVD